MRGMHHFRVEHGAVKLPRIIGDNGKGRALTARDTPKARRQGRDTITMAHPHLLTRALGPDAARDGAFIRHLHKGAAEFAVIGRLNQAAKLRR